MLVKRNTEKRFNTKQFCTHDGKWYEFPSEEPSVLDVPKPFADLLVKSVPDQFSYAPEPVIEPTPVEPEPKTTLKPRKTRKKKK